MSQPMAIDMDKLNAFVGRFVGDLGAAVHAGMVVLGEKLGLYKALAAHPMTSAELSARPRPTSVTCANGTVAWSATSVWIPDPRTSWRVLLRRL